MGFSENTSAPLLLENEAHLVPKKRVRKLVSTVSAQGILEYDLRSGHYHALGDYVLLRNEGGIEKSSTGAAKSASTARTSPPSAEPLSSPQVRAHPSGKKRQRTATPPPSSSPGTAAPATEATGPPSAQSLKNVKTSKTSDGESQTSAKKKKAQKIQKTPRAAEEAKAMSMSMATQLSQASQASSTSWSCLFNNNSTAADSSQDASSLSLTMAEADSSVAGSQQKVGSASKTPSRRSSSRNQTPSAGLSGGPRCSTFTEPAVEGQSSCSVSSSGLKGKEEGAGKAGPSRSSPRSAVKAARGTTRTPSGADTATTATAESHTTPLGGSTTPVDAASTGDSIELRASSRKWMNSPVESTARSGSAVKSSGGKVAKR